MCSACFCSQHQFILNVFSELGGRSTYFFLKMMKLQSSSCQSNACKQCNTLLQVFFYQPAPPPSTFPLWNLKILKMQERARMHNLIRQQILGLFCPEHEFMFSDPVWGCGVLCVCSVSIFQRRNPYGVKFQFSLLRTEGVK